MKKGWHIQTILRSRIYLPKQSDFSRADWSRARVLTNGNDVMEEQFAFLFLSHAISRETSTKMDVKIFQTDVIVAYSILLSTIEMASGSSIFSKLYYETNKPAVRRST